MPAAGQPMLLDPIQFGSFEVAHLASGAIGRGVWRLRPAPHLSVYAVVRFSYFRVQVLDALYLRISASDSALASQLLPGWQLQHLCPEALPSGFSLNLDG